MKLQTMLFGLCAGPLLGLSLLASAADDAPSVTTTAINDHLYLLKGRGGNVVASVGSDGVLLIDDDYANYQPAYKAAIAKLGNDQARFVINTHWHGDHTGSNAAWGETGSVIVAHDNVRQRLSTRQVNKFFDRVTEASPAAAWPLVTYAESMALHLNGDTIEVRHLPSGHTDGDSAVFFLESNVLHTGDHFFKDRFPFVDLASGGSVGGFIKNIETLLSMVGTDTVIVPGHGSLAGRQDLENYLEMLLATRDEVHKLMKAGLKLEAIQATGLDQRWESWGGGFINEANWIAFIVASDQM